MTVTADQQAEELVGTVRDDPGGRRELARRLYRDRPGRADVGSYCRAEMAFMSWQIRRGVLAGPDTGRPGSPWWRAVNEGLLRDSWEGGLLARGEPGTPSRPSVRHWVRFFATPSAEAWYRAHNASIVAGYLAHRDLAQHEHPTERFFMDVALVRMLYAHSLLAAPRLALGRFWPLGPLLGDPRWRGADAFLSLRNILPDRYPVRGWAIQQVLDAENYLGRLVDYGVILPRVQALYALSADTLDQPRLLDLIHDGAPVYAWPYEHRQVWTTTRAPLLIRTLARLTRMR